MNAAEDIRICAAEGSSGGRETITRDRAPVPRDCGGGEEERVSISSSWARAIAAGAGAVKHERHRTCLAAACAGISRQQRGPHHAQVNNVSWPPVAYSRGGMVRTQATIASRSSSLILLK